MLYCIIMWEFSMEGHWSLKTTLQLLQFKLISMVYLCSICVYLFILYMLCCFIKWASHIDEGLWSLKTTITGKLYNLVIYLIVCTVINVCGSWKIVMFALILFKMLLNLHSMVGVFMFYMCTM